MTNCDFSQSLQCPACGFVSRNALLRRNCPASNASERYVADVKEAAEKAGLSLPLGDWTEAGLSAIGLTKARVAEWAGNPDCGCEKRQQWLNELGGKLAAFFS